MDLQTYVCWKYGVADIPPITISAILSDCDTIVQFRKAIKAINTVYRLYIK